MMKGLAGKQLRQSQVLDRTQMVSIGVILLWIFAFAMMGISAYGNYVQAVARHIDNPWVISLGYQAVCSVAQWAFKSMRNWSLYIIFLGISVVPSIMTYHPLAHDALATTLNTLAPTVLTFVVANMVASVIIIVLLTVNDMAPEWILVK